jgi:hypothetical protein
MDKSVTQAQDHSINIDAECKKALFIVHRSLCAELFRLAKEIGNKPMNQDTRAVKVMNAIKAIQELEPSLIKRF